MMIKENDMNVFEHNNMFKASRISGPKHNYLGIEFSESEKDVELIEKQLPGDGKLTKSVDASELSRVVREAVAIEAQMHGQKLFVSKLEFVPTDSSDFLAYSNLAKAIAVYVIEKRIQMNFVS
jgi:hypothetical protein